jgi:hypothetical protein
MSTTGDGWDKMEISSVSSMRQRNDGEADPGEAICSKMVALTANETSGEVEELNCQERLRTEPVSRGARTDDGMEPSGRGRVTPDRRQTAEGARRMARSEKRAESQGDRAIAKGQARATCHTAAISFPRGRASQPSPAASDG